MRLCLHAAVRCVRNHAAACIILSLAACGGGNDSVSPAVESAATSTVTAASPVAGVTPFISFVTLAGDPLANAQSVNFQIAAKPGTLSKPVSVTYSIHALTLRGYVRSAPTSITVPIFGLYAGTDNAVTLNVTFNDATTTSFPLTVTTAAWVDPNAIYDHETVVQPRASGSALGFDFLYLKSAYGSPVILDTDGQVRWVGPVATDTYSSTYVDGTFIMGSASTADIYTVGLDGIAVETGSLAAAGVLDFGHDIEPGKTALFGNPDTGTASAVSQESTVVEFTPGGQVVATWDLARILSDAMTAGGDDPTLFVRPGLDWFHMNTAVYDATDDSVIVSSRENFVIKLDYASGAIRWILGDPTKYWHTFASLRAKALTVPGDGLVPIGQHAVTIAPDGSLMLFNNGTPSENQPAGEPAGASRAWSAVSDFVIDEAAGTATEAWRFDYGQSVLSAVCSSARAMPDGSLLVDYAYAESGNAARVVGLDPSHAVVFDYRFPNVSGCSTSWNAQPIALDALTID